ncbi:hypothetical protein CYLTODRAFT_187776 [Cylindrobasidium torrendii FP15055 ss-10]|uniref:Uncharacterized protein n=1 Tax=Cylindrobasidium torrendii FP15055 ss-10 TaxID=1314674 RepID=A0A0D7BJT5_9AGAR|nr:hypothetical protein CYLTODRAFT_187776 [Cylindrobasidium torrendii FP15055 ss-10]
MNTTPQDTIKAAIQFFDSPGRLNEQQVTYIVQLAEHFLSEAEPLSATNHWKAYEIVMQCAELTFEAINKLAKAIVARKAELPLSEFSSVFHCTLGFMGVVSTWFDLQAEDVRLNAPLIYERASKALLALTRAMGAQTYNDFPELEEVEQLRCLFAGTILLVDGARG